MADAIAELRAMPVGVRRAILQALTPEERQTVLGLLAEEGRPRASQSPPAHGLSPWLAERVEAAQGGQASEGVMADAVRDYLVRSTRSVSPAQRTPGRSLLEAVGGLGMTRRRSS